jgi:hypothetical protein
VKYLTVLVMLGGLISSCDRFGPPDPQISGYQVDLTCCSLRIGKTTEVIATFDARGPDIGKTPILIIYGGGSQCSDTINPPNRYSELSSAAFPAPLEVSTDAVNFKKTAAQAKPQSNQGNVSTFQFQLRGIQTGRTCIHIGFTAANATDSDLIERLADFSMSVSL